MSSPIRIRLAPIHHAGYQASNRINRPLPPHFEKCGGNYSILTVAETFAARLLGNSHIPTLPRHGMGSARRLTLERSHHNLIFAILRPLDSVKNHNRIRSRTGNGVYDLLFTTTDLTSFKTRSAVPIPNRSATSKRSLSEI